MGLSVRARKQTFLQAASSQSKLRLLLAVADVQYLAWRLRELFLSTVPAPSRKHAVHVFRLCVYRAATELPGVLSREYWSWDVKRMLQSLSSFPTAVRGRLRKAPPLFLLSSSVPFSQLWALAYF